MSILLYVKLIWCRGILYIKGQLEEGALVYVHSGICEMYMMQWYSIDLWSFGGEGRSELIWCSGIPHIYDQLEEGDQLS